jgi:hypothetical protein
MNLPKSVDHDKTLYFTSDHETLEKSRYTPEDIVERPPANRQNLST